MADSPILPGQHAWKLTPDGRLPVEFFQFLRDLIPFIRKVSGNTVDVAELETRVDALEQAPPDDAEVQGVLSVASQGTLANGLVQLLLQGDIEDPGFTFYYGTNAAGEKGWYAVADTLVQGDGIALTVNADGTTEVAHGDTSSVANISATFTGSTVPGEISFTFDQFGHVLTRTITGRQLDHNETGALQGGNATERYHFTAAEHAGLLPWASEARGDYALLTQTITDGDTTHAPSGDAVFDALALKANVPRGYIDGLPMQWVSPTALTVGSGSAYIESVGNIVQVPSAIAKAGLALAVATWYHVYLYLNAGVPDIEISTTDPVVYSGTARSKTGDSSRRYVGSFKTLASTDIIKFTHNPTTGEVTYLGNINAGPLSVVAGGNATVATTVSCAASVPITARIAKLLSNNNATGQIAYVSNSEALNALSTANWLAFVPSAGMVYANFPLDASQAFNYLYDAAPVGGTLFVRVTGYTYGR